MPRILVTGSASGLGRYLRRHFDGAGFCRDDSIENLLSSTRSYDAIIHCAANSSRHLSNRTLFKFLDDNILLTDRLTKIPHKTFIYLSSVDVYPGSDIPHKEDDIISIEGVRETYALSKLFSEAIVREKCNHYIILRPVAMIGEDARAGSLVRMLQHDHISLSLSSESTFNYVLHEDIASFIQLAITQNLEGIFNISSSSNISLGEAGSVFCKDKDITFGSFTYRTGDIDNRKAASLLPSFKRTSLDTIRAYIRKDHIKKRKET